MPEKKPKKEKTVLIPTSLYLSKQRFVFINIVMPLLAAVSVYDIVSCLLNSQATSYLTFFLFLIHSFICISACMLVRDAEKSSFYVLVGYCCYFIIVLCIPLLLGIISQHAYTQYFYAFSAVTGMSRLIAATLSVGTWLTVVMRVIFMAVSIVFFAYFLREIVKLLPLFNGEKRPKRAPRQSKPNKNKQSETDAE